MEQAILSEENLASTIFFLLLKLSNTPESKAGDIDYWSVPLYRKMYKQCLEDKKLTFILPAFPAKSSNPEKTSGPLPDLGEILALKTLNDFCHEVSKIYGPGIEITICSDGRVFNDIVFVSDYDLQLYKSKISEIIEIHGFSFLKTYDLDDYYKNSMSYKSMREEFCHDFSQSIEDIKFKVREDYQYRNIFNGLHRFLKEDMNVLRGDLSRNQVAKESKTLAYQLIQRSGAWDKLLSSCFEEALRLSIHPYPIEHKKFGVKLVPSSERWATPWHNVVVKRDGEYQLMKKREALEMGAVEKKLGGKYVYFE
ncbi:MAG: L-tyrosine/L-tryptophan isonitrile synthase family protein [Bacteriovoracaceae bacterium]|jgi:L-tyrosine isonitrile synthase|nr:L-tyrosine/L-tryptophan isonitrile synthase family protein [Bacteriovoracaceae bacterium]